MKSEQHQIARRREYSKSARLLEIANDMEHATAGGMSWISEDEWREFVKRIRKVAIIEAEEHSNGK